MSVASSFYQQGIHVNNVDDFLAGLKAMLTGTQPAISLEEIEVALKALAMLLLMKRAKDK